MKEEEEKGESGRAPETEFFLNASHPRLHLPQVISLNWNCDGPAGSTSSSDVIESADSGGGGSCC